MADVGFALWDLLHPEIVFLFCLLHGRPWDPIFSSSSLGCLAFLYGNQTSIHYVFEFLKFLKLLVILFTFCPNIFSNFKEFQIFFSKNHCNFHKNAILKNAIFKKLKFSKKLDFGKSWNFQTYSIPWPWLHSCGRQL